MKLSENHPAANKEGVLEKKKPVSPGFLPPYMSIPGTLGRSLRAPPPPGACGLGGQPQSRAGSRAMWEGAVWIAERMQ